MYYGKDHQVKCIVPRERIEIRAGEINKGCTAKNEILSFLKDKLGYIEGCMPLSVLLGSALRYFAFIYPLRYW